MGCWLSKGSPADTAMPQDEAMPERMAKAEAAAKKKKKRDEHGDAEAAAISLELDPEQSEAELEARLDQLRAESKRDAEAGVEVEGLVRYTRLEP